MNYNNRLTLILWIFRRNKSVVCQKSFSCTVTRTRKSQAFARLSKLSFSRILFLIATIPHIRFSNLGYKAFIKSRYRGGTVAVTLSRLSSFFFFLLRSIFSPSPRRIYFFSSSLPSSQYFFCSRGGYKAPLETRGNSISNGFLQM